MYVKKRNAFSPNTFPCLLVIAEAGGTKSAGSALANKACGVSCYLTEGKVKLQKAIPNQLMHVYRMSSYPKYICTSAERFQSICVIVLIVEAG